VLIITITSCSICLLLLLLHPCLPVASHPAATGSLPDAIPNLPTEPPCVMCAAARAPAPARPRAIPCIQRILYLSCQMPSPGYTTATYIDRGHSQMISACIPTHAWMRAYT
jgi:hypothetical protein